MKILNFLGLRPLVCAYCMTQIKLFLQLATNRLDFADNEDIIKLCNTLLQAYSRRISWIGDQANGENKIESRLDDMEKVKRGAIIVDFYNRTNWVFDGGEF